jgi:hypothetical protein
VADVTIGYDLPVLMREHAVLPVEFVPGCMRHLNRPGPGILTQRTSSGESISRSCSA